MDYQDTKTTIEWLRLYADMLESGKAVLEANRLDMTTDSIDMTTVEDNERVFSPVDSHHVLTVKVRVGSKNI